MFAVCTRCCCVCWCACCGGGYSKQLVPSRAFPALLHFPCSPSPVPPAPAFVAVDESGAMLPVAVRVGQAVDTVAQVSDFWYCGFAGRAGRTAEGVRAVL